VLTECWSWMDKTGGRVFEAELYRLQGELTLQQEKQKAQGKKQKAKMKPDARPMMPGAYSAAEARFHKAIDIARRQQAKSLELRATVSLARLWRQQGKQKEAHHMLAAIYSWFTEGLNTQDLREAKALLDELAQWGARTHNLIRYQQVTIEDISRAIFLVQLFADGRSPMQQVCAARRVHAEE